MRFDKFKDGFVGGCGSCVAIRQRDSRLVIRNIPIDLRLSTAGNLEEMGRPYFLCDPGSFERLFAIRIAIFNDDAISSARLAVSEGSAAVTAPTMLMPRAGRRPPVPPMKMSVPPDLTLLVALRGDVKRLYGSARRLEANAPRSRGQDGHFY